MNVVRRRLIRSAACTAVALGCVTWGCATNPATGKRQVILMSEAQEIALGRQSNDEIRKQMGVYNDANLQRYVDEVGAKLVRAAHRPNLPWTFTVVDEQAVNAFALPGGFVYITRGILPYLHDESQLAAVMGHEIGHVDARHSAQAYSSQTLATGGLAVLGILVPNARPVEGLANAGLGVLLLKFSREDELEADQLGVGYSSSSGWDPRGMPGMLATLARLDEATGSSRGVPNWALTHPPAADRVQKVQQAVAAAPAAGATNPAALDRYLDGLVYGDSREKGIVRGNEFLHPILKFAVRFPEGWEVTNGESQVVAQQSGPQGGANAAMVLQLSKNNGPVQQTGPAEMLAAGWTQQGGDRTSINGLDAYIGTYSGTMNNTPVTIQAAHVQAGSQVYVLAGLAPTAQFQAASRTFGTAIRSFRALSQSEADRVQPNRIDFHVARAGETWESIARTVSDNLVKPSALAIMNGSDIGTPPVPGTRLRVVVGG